MILKCHQCKSKRYWSLSDGRFKCKACRYKFSRPKPFNKRLVRKVLSEFLLEHSTNIILNRITISKRKLLDILTVLRIVMMRDVPRVFKETVEVDETYVGGQWKNKSKKMKRTLATSKRGRGTTKQPVFGILCRSGKVWAEVVESVEACDLQPRIEKQVQRGTTICSDTWRAYTGLAAKGYVHRLVNHGKQQYSDRRGGHINGLEGFWGYLKRKLSAKGGIRRSKLPLYLGELRVEIQSQKIILTRARKPFI